MTLWAVGGLLTHDIVCLCTIRYFPCVFAFCSVCSVCVQSVFCITTCTLIHDVLALVVVVGCRPRFQLYSIDVRHVL